jgi:hypothetical protein
MRYKGIKITSDQTSVTELTASAIFELESTTLGSIPAPKMTTTNKNAVSGVAGMQVYDTTLNELYLYNGSAWVLTPQIVSAPATASSTGVAGQIAYDSSYFYVCTATNTWVRTALATW